MNDLRRFSSLWLADHHFRFPPERPRHGASGRQALAAELKAACPAAA